MSNDIVTFMNNAMNNVHQGFKREDTLDAYTDISLLVRELRERMGLTQEKLATKLGVTFPTVNRWERGRAKPSPLAMQKIKELVHAMGDIGVDLINKYFPNE
jgi:putative transcriptional regulator